ncbi:uncharacterized protein [Primulina eburnea]|uniref:uncharacterized protein n=1 Tax=Primulina eburnea TaxID=1245227 RepID=UPI003C6C59E4
MKNSELQLHKNVVQAIVLQMPEFDIILGMDWLSSNGASIDFWQRSISVRQPSGKYFIFEAARNKQMSRIISCIYARKLLKRGCQAFLVSIVSDLSQEVNFSIEPMPGTVPISRVPYRVALAEMKELKAQIQDLLDKGFIRPRFSPSSAPVLFVKKKDHIM